MHLRPSALAILRQWRFQHGWPLEHQPLRSSDHAIDDGALQQLATNANDVPAEPINHALRVQPRKEAFDVTAIGNPYVRMLAIRADNSFLGVIPVKAGTSGAARQPSHTFERGKHRYECLPESADLVDAQLDCVRYPLGVEI